MKVDQGGGSGDMETFKIVTSTKVKAAVKEWPHPALEKQKDGYSFLRDYLHLDLTASLLQESC